MTNQLDIFGANKTPAQKASRVWKNKKRASPRHSNTVRRVLRVGQMAWEGRSAGEIADEIGVGTAYVYQLCSDYRIRLVPKTRAQYAFIVTIQLKDLYGLEQIGSGHGIDVPELAARLLSAMSREPVIAANLLDGDGA